MDGWMNQREDVRAGVYGWNKYLGLGSCNDLCAVLFEMNNTKPSPYCIAVFTRAALVS